MPSSTGISMSITTASGETRFESSIASRPLCARPATVKRWSCSSRSAMASRKVSSSSATRIRNGGLSFISYSPRPMPYPRRGASNRLSAERLLEIRPKSFGVLESGAEAEQAGRHAVALPAAAALDERRHATERRGVDDHARGRLDLPRHLRVGDVEGEEPAEPGIADDLDGRMLAQPRR